MKFLTLFLILITFGFAADAPKTSSASQVYTVGGRIILSSTPPIPDRLVRTDKGIFCILPSGATGGAFVTIDDKGRYDHDGTVTVRIYSVTADGLILYCEKSPLSIFSSYGGRDVSFEARNPGVPTVWNEHYTIVDGKLVLTRIEVPTIVTAVRESYSNPDWDQKQVLPVPK